MQIINIVLGDNVKLSVDQSSTIKITVIIIASLRKEYILKAVESVLD
jgi:hypothetical protein